MPKSSQQTLRAYLRQKNSDLAARLDHVWRVAAELHERQTLPDKDRGGTWHCEKVEENAWRLILAAGQRAAFEPIELFLLSAAACCHDFDKGLKSALPADAPHGEGSGELVARQAERLGLNPAEAAAVKSIVILHDKVGPAFTLALGTLPHAGRMPIGANVVVELRRLGVLLKAADVLDTDCSRLSDVAVDPERLTGVARSKWLARGCISGWEAGREEIKVAALPQTAEQKEAFWRAFQFMREQEWQPLVAELRAYHLPHQLRPAVDDGLLAQAECTAESSARRLPGMDHYHRADAPLLAGREADVRALEGLVYGHSLCALVGPSGVGKSSVLHAGLAPAVERLEGWQCVITRPDKQTGRFFTPRTFAGLLHHEPDPNASFAEVCRQTLAECRRLLVVLDQFEDAAYFGLLEVDAVAREISDAVAGEENLRVLLAYRDDVTSTIGPLENQLAESARGLPKHFLQRLDTEGAEAAIRRLLDLLGLRLEPDAEFSGQLVADLVAATQAESATSGQAVYPPYLQMAVERLADLAAEGVVRLEDYQSLAAGSQRPMDRVLLDYLARNVEKLKDRGHDVAQAKRVLVCLARTSGRKGAADLARIAAEAQVPAEKLGDLLSDMASLRLVRRLESDQWEIAHDLLARRVAETLIGEPERRFKHAREGLEHKARAYRHHRSLLTPEELRDLWLHRSQIPPGQLDDAERALILVSQIAGRVGVEDLRGWPDRLSETGGVTPPSTALPGSYWLSDLSVERLCTILGRLAGIGDPPSLDAFLAIGGLLRCDRLIPPLLDVMRSSDWTYGPLASHVFVDIVADNHWPFVLSCLEEGNSHVRSAAQAAARKLAASASREWLQEQLESQHEVLRREAARALCKRATAADLPFVVRNLDHADSRVQQDAVACLGRLATSQHLLLLEKHLERGPGPWAAAVLALGRLDRPRAVSLVRSAADRVNYFTGRRDDLEDLTATARPEDLPFLRELLAETDSWLRRVVLGVIGRIGLPEDLPLVVNWLDQRSQSSEHEGQGVLHAFARRAVPEQLSLWRDLARSPQSWIRHAAAGALCAVGTAEDLPVMRELLGHGWRDQEVAFKAVSRFPTEDQQGMLRQLMQSPQDDFLVQACETIAECIRPEHAVDTLMPALLDTRLTVSAAAAEIVGRRVPHETILAFLEEHQERMTTRALAVLDWFLYAPAYLREGYERWKTEQEKKD